MWSRDRRNTIILFSLVSRCLPTNIIPTRPRWTKVGVWAIPKRLTALFKLRSTILTGELERSCRGWFKGTRNDRNTKYGYRPHVSRSDNIRHSVPPTCVDNWCYYRKVTEVRTKPGMNTTSSHVNVFSSDRRLYIQNYVYAHTFCHISFFKNTSGLIPTTACSTLRLVILSFFRLMITALSGTEEAYSTYARHLILNLVQWSQHNTNTKACRWKWPGAMFTNLPWSDFNVVIPSSTQCSTWALCYRVSHHVSIHFSSLSMCYIGLMLY